MSRILVNWNLRSVHHDYDKLSASVWIRCMQLIPYLKNLGVDSTINDPFGPAEIQIFIRNQNKQAQKLARKLKKQGKYIVFDIVVNYFDEAENIDGPAGTSAEQVSECRRMVESANLITCASEFIRQRALAHHDNVAYLADSISRHHFRFRKKSADFLKKPLKAIWSGVSVKTGELAKLYPLLSDRGISLIVISDQRPDLPGPFTFVPWSYHTFPQAILEGDICVAPRKLDNPYNRGHSIFKIGVFMTQGVPALGSPLMSYEEVIGKADAGMICDSEQDWQQALDSIMDDRGMLQTWSEKSYQAMEPYTTAKIAERYTELFKKALKS
jgi:hypothetical protein